MNILLFVCIPLFVVLFLVFAIGWLVCWRRRISPRRFFGWAGLLGLGFAALYVFVGVPQFFGWYGVTQIGTRSFERGYPGPRFDAEGKWRFATAPFETAEGPAPIAPVFFDSEDGVRLRGFVVAPPEAVPRQTWVAVHGLFRNAFELETVASMLRDLGCRVLMLELRNHGGSGRAPATFGKTEANDVVAAVRWLREVYDVQAVGLFGVSLGSIAVALAAERCQPVGAIVLDAPIRDVAEVAETTLARGPRRVRAAIPEPLRSSTLRALQSFGGFEFASIRPQEALRALPATVPVLLIGGADDFRVPPEAVREYALGLPTDPAHKSVWIREGSDHGRVWIDDPVGYRERLARIVENFAAR